MDKPGANMVAKLAECRRLFDLSWWDGTMWSWYCDEGRDDDPAVNLTDSSNVVGGVGYYDRRYPAYDATFLIGMLPPFELRKFGDCSYAATWTDYTSGKKLSETSRTNAASAMCRLAIALYENGILLSPKTAHTSR